MLRSSPTHAGTFESACPRFIVLFGHVKQVSEPFDKRLDLQEKTPLFDWKPGWAVFSVAFPRAPSLS
jgi:hypothetical protein